MKRYCQRGLTLIEVLVAGAITVLLSGAIYSAYASVLRTVDQSKVKSLALFTANEILEVARNLPYDQVGLVAGVPAGILPRNQTLVRNGLTFHSTTTIRNIDDPFDGQISNSQNRDLSPGDYKLVAVEIGCASCRVSPLTVTTTIAPKNLEGLTGNGALFIEVTDAESNPVAQAVVRVVNNLVSPKIDITETTNNSGMFQLVDTPPSVFGYEVAVSKGGYSKEETYPLGGPIVANPSKPDATVNAGNFSELSFQIDRLSNLSVKTMTDICTPVSGVDLTLRGQKLLGDTGGANPDPVYKYDHSHTTGSGGLVNISNLEWDKYLLAVPGATGYDLAGSLPLLPLSLSPGATSEAILVLAPKKSKALMVTVKDAATGLPLTGSTVEISGMGDGETLVTNRGFLRQSDWSNGPGQVIFSDPKKFFDSDGNIHYGSSAGGLALASVGEVYANAGILTSSVFDMGSASTTLFEIDWFPQNQPTASGPNSLRFQVAASNDVSTSTWNWMGPDGTNKTYFISTQKNIPLSLAGNRYFRYRVFLTTVDPRVTPKLSEVMVTFSSECLPFGQVLFQGLSGGAHELTVTKEGYQENIVPISLNSDWQSLEINLINE